MRKLLVMTLLSMAASPATAQENLPAFEVVSVKTNRSGELGFRTRLLPGGRVTITNAPLRPLIETAYGMLPQQVTGGPGWLDSERFDIAARVNGDLPPTTPGGPPGPAQLMLQRLLAERFNLVVRTEKRELQIYALAKAREDGRLGPAISPAKVDCAAAMTAYGRGTAPLPPPSDCGITGAPGRVSARGASMAMFGRMILAGVVGRVVEDRTGLTDGFDFELTFAVDPGTVGTAAGPDGASIFTALEEQLGLKLRSVRAAVDVLLIDRVERPTEN